MKNPQRADRYSLSPINSIDGGEGWGEGAALTLAETHGNALRIPLTQPSPPSTLGGEGSRPPARSFPSIRPLSPISLIDGGEGWGEGAALTLAATRRNASRLPLTQPSPPSTLGGEGLHPRVHSFPSIEHHRDTARLPR